MPESLAGDETGVFIDGEYHTMQTLSYREQRTMRDEVTKLAPNGDTDEAGEMDILPALYYVVKRRTDPEYTIDQALDIKPVDLEPPKETAPPRKRRASPK